MGEQATGDNIIRPPHIVCWLTKATDTHPEYVILNAFPLQQLLFERDSMLCYTYIACLVWCVKAKHGFGVEQPTTESMRIMMSQSYAQIPKVKKT
jgi:hypothetical protein